MRYTTLEDESLFLVPFDEASLPSCRGVADEVGAEDHPYCPDPHTLTRTTTRTPTPTTTPCFASELLREEIHWRSDSRAKMGGHLLCNW